MSKGLGLPAVSWTSSGRTKARVGEEDAAADSVMSRFEENMRELFRRFGQMQRNAVCELSSSKVSQRIDRARTAFIQDYETSARREQAVVRFEEIEMALDDTLGSDETRAQMQVTMGKGSQTSHGR